MAPTPAVLPKSAMEHQPDAHPFSRHVFWGSDPSTGDCRSPQLAEAVGTQAEQRHGGLAAQPSPACGSASSLTHHRVQHPSPKIRSAALLDEDKGPKHRPPPPRWPGRWMSNDISQS